MVTILREHGLRVVIFANDHEPAHVHVFGDGETKIALRDADDAPKVVRCIGANAAEIRRALLLVRRQQSYLLQRWSELHG